MIIGGINTSTDLESVSRCDNVKDLWAEVIKKAARDLQITVNGSKNTFITIAEAYDFFCWPNFKEDRDTVFLYAGLEVKPFKKLLRPQLDLALSYLKENAPQLVRKEWVL